MKTPEQIADEMFNSDISLSQDDKAVIIAAIEADRAQRPKPLTENEWRKTPEYIDGGYSGQPRRQIVMEWGDLTETPREAVIRLNREAMEYQELSQIFKRELDTAIRTIEAIRTAVREFDK